MKETCITETFCPHCGSYLDTATGLNQVKTPGPGDITFCYYCCNVLIFNNELKPTEVTPEQWQELGEEFQNTIKCFQDRLLIAKQRNSDA